ncbi:hypothetical protein EAH78_18740 [Pseudomonas arsenicoxydans]|uniref:Uncharacterized protein n=1 Tax=Pseudomonas arsenicoxydans TaxID=702115 RepID=A0A502HRD3_9PSED|nr:hypothetical protein EAH78_18740 [Pseudomonas arsenicoxydans]
MTTHLFLLAASGAEWFAVDESIVRMALMVVQVIAMLAVVQLVTGRQAKKTRRICALRRGPVIGAR